MDVHASRLERADAADFSQFEHAEESGLRRRRQTADLIEEERPAVGELEQSRLVFDRPQEAAAHVSEELALEHGVVDRGTVHCDEPAIAPRADAVQRARHELLARAGLAGHERQAHVWCEAPDHPEEVLHARTSSDHPAELEPSCQVAFHRQDTATSIDLVAHARQQLVEAAEVERLGEIVHRAELHRFDGGVERCIARHQHCLAVRVDVADRAKNLEAADLGHPQIDHHQIGPARLNQRDGLAAVSTYGDVEARALGETGHDVEDPLLIVDDYE